MNDLNKVLIIGRLIRDAEFKATQQGIAFCKFTIAYNRTVKRDNGWKSMPGFFDCTCWGKTAEKSYRLLLKGVQVFIDGFLRQVSWEKDGKKSSKIEIVADNLQLLSDRKEIDENIPF